MSQACYELAVLKEGGIKFQGLVCKRSSVQTVQLGDGASDMAKLSFKGYAEYRLVAESGDGCSSLYGHPISTPD